MDREKKFQQALILLLAAILVFGLFLGIYKILPAPATGGSISLTSQADWRLGTYHPYAIDVETSPGDVKLFVGSKDGACTHWFSACTGREDTYWSIYLGSNDQRYFKFPVDTTKFPADVTSARLYLYAEHGFYSIPGGTPPGTGRYLPYNVMRITSNWNESPMVYSPTTGASFHSDSVDFQDYIPWNPMYGDFDINNYISFELSGGTANDILNNKWGGPYGFSISATYLDQIGLRQRENANPSHRPYLYLTFANGDTETVYMDEYAASISDTHTSAATQIDGGTSIQGWTTFVPDATIPANTSISFRFRTSDDGATWSGWSASIPFAASIDISSLAAQRYLQVETTLSDTDGTSTPILSAFTVNYNYGGTPISSSPTHTPSISSSYTPSPSFSPGVQMPLIINIIDNVNHKTYDVSHQQPSEPVEVCDHQPTFIGAVVLEDYLEIFDSDNKQIDRSTTSPGFSMWSASPSRELDFGNYHAYAGPLGPTNTVWFNVVECENGTPKPTPTVTTNTPPPTTTPPSCSTGNPKDCIASAEEVNPFLVAALLLLASILSLADPYTSAYAYFYRLWFNFLEWLGIRKKREPWGVVYDYINKKPINLAVVRLSEKDSGRVKEMFITDKTGAFSFSPPPNKYFVLAYKAGFVFPVKKFRKSNDQEWISGISDSHYQDIYGGGTISLNRQGETINFNIPLDNSNKRFFWNKSHAVIDVFVRFLNKIRIPILILGTAISLLALASFHTIFDIFTFIFFILLWLLEILRSMKPTAPFGKITDANTGAPISLALLRLIKVEDKQEKTLLTKATDANGTYNFLVSPGFYRIKIEKAGFGHFESKILNVNKERYLDIDIKLRK